MYLSLSLRWPPPLGTPLQDGGISVSSNATPSAFSAPVSSINMPPACDHSQCPYQHCLPYQPFRASVAPPFALHAAQMQHALMRMRIPSWVRPHANVDDRSFSLHPLKSTFEQSQEILAAGKVGIAQRMPLWTKSGRFEVNSQYSFDKKMFTCAHCRYVTDRKNNLKRHVATMHQNCDKALECCGVTFANKASLRDHVTIFHSSGYMCRYCGRNFCRKALLKRHLTVHSGRKDYVCDICEYATSHKSNLERHRRIHERPDTEDMDGHSGDSTSGDMFGDTGTSQADIEVRSDNTDGLQYHPHPSQRRDVAEPSTSNDMLEHNSSALITSVDIVDVES